MGLGASNLQEWVQDLLKKVVFKVKHMLIWAHAERSPNVNIWACI